MNEDGKEQGYKFSRLWLNKHLSTLEKWDVEEIEKRFDLLAERFLKIWKFPAIAIEEEISTDEENIFDADEPTGKKLEYAIFFEQKLEVKNITDLYIQVIITLFELNPQAFFSEGIEQKLTLTQNPSNCRVSVSLNETYFIETHLNSKDKFDKLKYLLTTMDITDELYIKYAQED
jgi:hypothetical protein